MYFEGEQTKFKTSKGNTCFKALQSFAELHLEQVRRALCLWFFAWYDSSCHSLARLERESSSME